MWSRFLFRLLVLLFALAVKKEAFADPIPTPEAAPMAEADPYHGYGYKGYGRGMRYYGYGKRSAQPDPRHHYYGGGYGGYGKTKGGYRSYGYGKRSAEPDPN